MRVPEARCSRCVCLCVFTTAGSVVCIFLSLSLSLSLPPSLPPFLPPALSLSPSHTHTHTFYTCSKSQLLSTTYEDSIHELCAAALDSTCDQAHSPSSKRRRVARPTNAHTIGDAHTTAYTDAHTDTHTDVHSEAHTQPRTKHVGNARTDAENAEVRVWHSRLAHLILLYRASLALAHAQERTRR